MVCFDDRSLYLGCQIAPKRSTIHDVISPNGRIDLRNSKTMLLVKKMWCDEDVDKSRTYSMNEISQSDPEA